MGHIAELDLTEWQRPTLPPAEYRTRPGRGVGQKMSRSRRGHVTSMHRSRPGHVQVTSRQVDAAGHEADKAEAATQTPDPAQPSKLDYWGVVAKAFLLNAVSV